MKSFFFFSQFGYCLIIIVVFGLSSSKAWDVGTFVGLIVPGLWIVGGVLIKLKRVLGEIVITVCAILPLLYGTHFHVVRIGFIKANGGMEGEDGLGSPMAFLLGWVFTTVVFFLPGDSSAEQDEAILAIFDSGSPLFVETGKEWRLAGVASTASNRSGLGR